MALVRYIWPVLLLFGAVSCGTSRESGSSSPKEAEVRDMISERDYVFKVQTVLPMGGGSRYMTGNYDLEVSGGTVKAYLPYFGRAYSAPVDPSEGGIHFESNDFDYQEKERKKDGWEIRIIPRDTDDIRQLFLTVSSSGSASLNVTTQRRQPISFNGYIERTEN